MEKIAILSRLNNQRGAVGLMVTLLTFFVFLPIAALGVDMYRNFVILPNELQNAADAGALAGAANLYNNYGTAINTNANLIAQQVAFENLTNYVPQAEGEFNRLAPEVVAELSANTGDVQRGHWSFGLGSLSRGFYPDEAPLVEAPPRLSNYTTVELDENLDFINAVRVVAARSESGTPIYTFFARILGHEYSSLMREAVAYIGFAGRLNPAEADQPIAMCEEFMLNEDGEYDCSVGRMINSGNDKDDDETTIDPDHFTGGWTNFNQAEIDESCSDIHPPASASSIRPLICTDGNPFTLVFGRPTATLGGQAQNLLADVTTCWDQYTIINNLFNSGQLDDLCGQGTDLIGLLDRPEAVDEFLQINNRNPKSDLIRMTWELRLPVIACPEGDNVGPCNTSRGAVTVSVAWINDQVNTNNYLNIPMAIFGPVINEDTGEVLDPCGKLWDATNLPDGTGEGLTPQQQVDQRIAIWDSFVSEEGFELTWGGVVTEYPPGLNLQDQNGTSADYLNKTLYYKPDCSWHELAGNTGGENFGILARIPVLVCPDRDKYPQDGTCMEEDS